MNCTSPVFGLYPCGHCPNCLARSRQEWVFRIKEEFKDCNFGLFVTLTYSDEKLPPDGVCKRDIQLFLKRLRKHFDSKVLRYYIISEYGDHTHRAHYHGLFFFKCERKNDIYDIITESWNNGFTQFGEIEEGSIVYCTKYCLKKSDVPKGKNDNFRLLSKMDGGIGIYHLNELSDFYTCLLDKPQMVTSRESTSPMPRYYRSKMLSRLDPEDKECIKQLYSENLERAREKQRLKLLKQFKSRYPGKDPFELRDYGHQTRTNFDIWLLERSIAREEMILKRTKKQNLL